MIDPLPLGEVRVLSSEYEGTVFAVDPDATAVVMEENSFNDPPRRGHVFVLIGVDLKYFGDPDGDPSTAWLDVGAVLIGSDRTVYSTSGSASSCGVIPGDLDDLPDVLAGGALRGNLCTQVPQSIVEGDYVIGLTAGDSAVGDSPRWYWSSNAN